MTKTELILLSEQLTSRIRLLNRFGDKRNTKRIEELRAQRKALGCQLRNNANEIQRRKE